MAAVTVHAAKTQLSKLIARVRGYYRTRQDACGAAGALSAQAAKRGLGSIKGEVWLDESFWQPLSQEEPNL